MIVNSRRVVLDTTEIVAAGSRWLHHVVPTPDPNQHRRLLICVAERHVGLYCSPIILEYIAKLLEHGSPTERVLELIAYVIGSFESVNVVSSAAPVPPTDPDDEIFVICAIDGAADYLVSEDYHLLALKSKYQRPVIGTCSDLISSLAP